MNEHIPVIDVFAGPGGLGEGFSASGRGDGHHCFKIGLSVEKDKYAHSTLELRSFFRKFPYSQVPEDYYAFIRGELTKDELFQRHPEKSALAKEEAWLAALGSGQDFDDELDRRIEKIIGNSDKWVLIGGPPCQAYSVIGRARINKENDDRNYLYLEYLRIIARHRPAVFVMENVKGILSSKIQGKRIFDQIMTDLKDPSSAFPQYVNLHSSKYRIFSLVKKSDNTQEVLKPEDYIVECEKYGIPHARHRVILLGIREDLNCTAPEVLEPAPDVAIKAVLAGLPRLRSGLSREEDSSLVWKLRLSEALERRWIKGTRTKWGQQLADRLEQIISNARVPSTDRGGEYIPCDVTVNDGLKWWYHDDRINGVCNHSSRGHMLKDIYRYLYASCFSEVFKYSPRLHEFPPDLLPEHKNVKSGHFDDRFRVQLYNSPSSTITCHISKDGHYYIHPDPWQCRSLTVREAARLQTFPDNYFFSLVTEINYAQIRKCDYVICDT